MFGFEDFSKPSNWLEEMSGNHSNLELSDEFLNAPIERPLSVVKPFSSEILADPAALVERVDEVMGYRPPKGVDFDPEVAELIEPVKDQLESKYLEAPSDLEQVGRIGDYLAETPELRFENWCQLDASERQQVLQQAENRIAEIEHRESCPLNFEAMDSSLYGFFSSETKDITINSLYVNSNDFGDYREMLDTLIHEGRHAYQDYNIDIREVHSDASETKAWEHNFDHYVDGNWDFQSYFNQPVEKDAREFAEAALDLFLDTTTA